VLRCYGREGLQALIREHVRLAAQFERWVAEEPGWEVSAPRHFSTVCFRHLELDNDELGAPRHRDGTHLRRDDETRRASVIRLAIGNAWTSEEDVRVAWEVLRECAR